MTDLQVFTALDALKSADYLSAFRSLRLSKHDLKMLRTHYDAPEQTLTATQMAHALGYERHGTANAHYGKLATRVGEELGLQPELSLNVLATFDWPQGEQCKWIMRHQVADALEKLGWVATKRTTTVGDQKKPRFWTCHWQFRYWRPDINREGQPCCSSGSNSFRKRGVSAGDSVYIISLSAGQLYLGGRMLVKRIVSRPEAVRLWNTDNLYDAEEWAVDPERTGTLLHLHRRLSPGLTKQLRFESKAGPREPFFVSETELDNQATRGVRELTPESASLLDKIIEVTDKLPRSDQLITVTEELLRNGQVQDRTGESTRRQAGAGFGNPAENKEVEVAAIRTVKKKYEADGWHVRSVERERCGFDLECRKSQVVENVEVKGVRSTEQSFFITENEVAQARTNPTFVLVVVTSALSESPILARYSGPDFCRKFELSAVQYRAVLRG
jgi:hypothetical protein